MNIKILATDMDGTLLDDYKRLSDRNKEALQQFHHSGVQVVLCTGRPFHTVQPYLPLLNIPCWLITNNGSVIRNPQGEIIHTHYLEADTLKKVLVTLHQLPRLSFHGSDSQTTYVGSRLRRMKNIYDFERKSLSPPVKAAFHAFYTVWLSPVHRQVDFLSFVQKGGQLANLIIISKDLEALEIKKQQLEGIQGIYLTRSGHDNLEVLAQEATKGNALLWLAQHLGVEMEEVAAIGDHDNDLSMIRMAGHGFATGNAEETAKKEAAYVTSTNNEDALWDVFQRIHEAGTLPKKAVNA